MTNPPLSATPAATAVPGVRSRLVRLSDGAHWGLARPSELIRPVFESSQDEFGRPETTVRVVDTFGFPEEVNSRIDTFHAALGCNAESPRIEAFVALASALLRRAHAVDEVLAARLLEVNDEVIPRLVDAVISVVGEARPRVTDDIESDVRS